METIEHADLTPCQKISASYFKMAVQQLLDLGVRNTTIKVEHHNGNGGSSWATGETGERSLLTFTFEVPSKNFEQVEERVTKLRKDFYVEEGYPLYSLATSDEHLGFNREEKIHKMQLCLFYKKKTDSEIEGLKANKSMAESLAGNPEKLGVDIHHYH